MIVPGFGFLVSGNLYPKPETRNPKQFRMLLHLTVSKIERETAQAVTIHFPQPKVHKIWYKAGQFITLAVEIKGKKYFRSYSICTAPRLDDTLAITVKRVPGGLVSNFLNDSIQVGDSFNAMRPSGRFLIENSVKFQRKVYLIGGGSGITPLMSILRSVLFNEPKSEVVLFYANSSKDEIIFHDKLRKLESMFASRLKVYHFISKEKKKAGAYYPGRLQASVFTALLEENRSDGKFWEDELCYLCGPQGLMAEAKKHLLLAGIGAEKIFEEKFFAEDEVIISSALSSEPHEVEVGFAGENYVFSVPAETSILEAALQQNIPLPHSCRRGICSTCMGKKLSGEVMLANNESLTDWEVNQGFVLVCQSYPQDEAVKISMD